MTQEYFLVGYVKFLVYNDKSASIAALSVNIERLIGEMLAEMCEKMAPNCFFRLDQLKRSRDQHWDEIIS